jgi:hypothetical protein
MPEKRHHPRTARTKDLSATLRPAEGSRVVADVLNLSEGGMLVAARSDRVMQQPVGFELAGPGFRFAGQGEIVHRTDRTTGLRFLSWQGPAGRPICALVASRLTLTGSAIPGLFPSDPPLPCRRPTHRDSRKHDRAPISMLSVVITQPSGDTNRHAVLDVSERGMLIDGLLLPVGAGIDFVLEDWPLSYVGRGRVAHRTDTAAGVAVDHWHGPPDAIHDLIAGDARRRPQQNGYITEDGYITDWSRVSKRRLPGSPSTTNTNRMLL